MSTTRMGRPKRRKNATFQAGGRPGRLCWMRRRGLLKLLLPLWRREEVGGSWPRHRSGTRLSSGG